MNDTITREQIPAEGRADHVDQLFGIHFPLKLEPTIFHVASQLSPDYRGGYWTFYKLSNGAFYMSPDLDRRLAVTCPDGYRDDLSAEAFGIAVCLYAYSQLSFTTTDRITQTFAEQYHRLRAYVLELTEASAVLAATD